MKIFILCDEMKCNATFFIVHPSCGKTTPKTSLSKYIVDFFSSSHHSFGFELPNPSN